jgi:uncharacterized membrane protein
LSVIFRFVHVLAAIMWIGNSLLFTWMEFNLIPPKTPSKGPDPELLGHLDMLHGGGVFHLQKRVINPAAIPTPLHWFMWQSYTTWISGILLMVSVFYIHGGAALLDSSKSDLPAWGAIGLSAGGIIGWWILYDSIWRTKLMDKPWIAVPLTISLILVSAYLFSQHFNGRAVFLQIGAMLGSAMSANVFFHIIRNQKKFMANLLAGRDHDMKYGMQAKRRSMHNHYMTFPVLFLMLSAHFPQLTRAEHPIAVLGVVIIALMAIKHLMNSRYHFRHWLVSIFGVLMTASVAIGLLISPSQAADASSSGARLFVSQGCAACHQTGTDQLAPDLQGIFESTRLLADGSSVLADEIYLRRSILEPQAQVVKGYAAAMPPYAHLAEEQIDQLVGYLKSLE